MAAVPPPNTAPQNSRVWKDWYSRLKKILDSTDVLLTSIYSRYTIKVTAGGAIAGIGLIATDNDSANATSAVIVQADKFAVVSSSYAGGPDTTPAAEFVMFGVDGDGAYVKGNLKVTGQAKIDGQTTIGSSTAALHVNNSSQSALGMVSYSTTAGGVALFGNGSAGASGVTGVSSGGASGTAVYGVTSDNNHVAVKAQHGGTGTALQVIGKMTIDNATLVDNLNADWLDGKTTGNGSGNIPVNNGTVCTNLNADLLDGNHSTAFATSSHNHSGVYLPLNGTADNSMLWNGLAVTAGGTGTAVPTLSSNKPGSNSGVANWLAVTISGSTFYIPVWT